MRQLSLIEKQYIENIKNTIKEKVIGKITPDHDEFGHWYILPDGKRVASVTSKLIIEKPHLAKWAAKLALEWMEKEDRWTRLSTDRDSLFQGAILAHTEERDSAGNIGTQAHNIIEEYLIDWMNNGTPVSDIRQLIEKDRDYRVFGACRSAEKAFQKYEVVPVATELLVGSSKFNCAGTLDLLMVNLSIPEFPELELFDHKTSNAVKDDYALQVSAYKYFFEEMTGLKIKRCRIEHLSKDSDKFKLYNIPNIVQAFKAFKQIVGVYDWINNGKKKLIEDKIIIKI